ncbi:dockerin type I domain-containing protein [Paraprevotella xylaniphila]|uniref:dockerin type I domain-containing protein n=1 Tax=Paraprevotella xylaniphila TaxID=454155 RepID=UPI0030774E51
MKKKTLVSVLAMASASMAAYANANLDQIKTEVDQWVGAEKPSLVNGVLTSPNGTTISQSLGSLLPGTYKLSATTSMNAKFLVNGKALTNGEFKVEGTAASEVTLAIEAVETGKEFRVGGFKLELVFDFAGAQRTLLNAASKAIAKVSQEDDADKYAEFNKRYSDLTVKINRVKDDAAGDFAAYTVYGEYKFYLNGVEGSTLMSEVKALDTDIEAHLANWRAYTASKAVGEEQKTALKSAWDTNIGNLSDADGVNSKQSAQDYAKVLSQSEYNAAKETIDAFLLKIEGYYDNGTAATECTPTFNSEFAKKASEAIKKFTDKLVNVDKNHTAYDEVLGKINFTKAHYNEQLQAFMKVAVDPQDFPGLYETMRTEAHNAFNEVNLGIVAVERKNGTNENHQTAEEGYEANTHALDSLYKKTDEVHKFYTDSIQNNDNIYKALIAERTDGKSPWALLAELKKDAVVSEKYKSELEKAEADLKAIETEVVNQYKKYTLDAYTQKGGAYEKAKELVTTSLNAIIEKEYQSLPNYQAKVELTAALDVQTASFDKAKTEVHALKYGDVSVGDIYKDTDEKTLQGEIDAFSSYIKKSFDEGTCADNKDTKKAEIEALKGEIQSYVNTAKAVVKVYDNAAKTISDIQAEIKKLSDKVGNGDGRYVPVYTGTETPDENIDDLPTYGGKLDEMNKTLSDLQTALKAATVAKDADGDTHANGMNNVLTEATNAKGNETTGITGEVKTLVGTFDKHKEWYDQQVVVITINRLKNQITADIKSVNDDLDGLSVTAEIYGSFAKNLLEKQTVLYNSVDKIEKTVTDLDYTSEDKQAETLAALSDASAEMAKLLEDVSAFIDEVGEAKEIHAKNNSVQASLTKVADGIAGNIGKIDANWTPIDDKDVSKKHFDDLKGSYTTELGKQETAMVNAYKGDTLHNDSAAIHEAMKVIDGKVKATLTELEVARKNLAAYERLAVETKKTDIHNLIVAELGELSNLALGNSENHYVNGLLGENTNPKGMYVIDFDNWVANVNAAWKSHYNDNSDESCQTREDNFKEGYTDICEKIKQVSKDAETNIKVDNTLDTEYATVKNSVDSLYTILTVGDPTTAAKAFIEQLEAEKSKLEGQVAKDIATAFEKGKSDEQYGTIHGVLQTIRMQVVTIGASREQGYVDAVKTDNQTRYNSFNSAVEDMRNCYIEAVDVIGQVSKVQTPELLNVVKSAVETANASIQNYLQEINNIENEAFAAFSEAQNTDKMLFDPDKQYEADVRAYESKIDQILYTMDAAVQSATYTFFDGEYETANKLYKDARQELVDADYVTADEAFANVKSVLEKAEAIKDFVPGQFNITKVDGIVSDFANFEAWIADGKEPAAVYEWETLSTDTLNQYNSHLTELEEWYENGAYLEGVDGKKFVDDIKATRPTLTEAEKTYADNTGHIYGAVMEELHAKLEQFGVPMYKAYVDGKKEHNLYVTNNDVYNVLIEKVEALQAPLDEAAKYVDAYILTDTCGVEALQARIDRLMSDLETKRYEGGLDNTYKTTAENECKNITTSTERVYRSANMKESVQILAEFNVLQAACADAQNKVKGDADAEAEVNALSTAIKEKMAAFTKDTAKGGAIDNAETKAKQPLFLAYETWIAGMRTKLATYTDAAATENAYTVLMNRAGEVEGDVKVGRETLAACHANVQGKFEGDMAGLESDVVAVKDGIEQNKANMLFYQDKLNHKMDVILSDLKTLLSDIAKDQERYTLNDEAYEARKADMAHLNDSLTTVVDKLTGFEYYKVDEKANAESIADITAHIGKYGKAMDEYYADIELAGVDAENTLKSIMDKVLWRIDSLDCKASGIEYTGVIDKAQSDRSELVKSVNNHTFIVEVEDALRDTLNLVNKDLNIIEEYNEQAKDGYVDIDINGNNIVSTSIHYVKEALPQIQAALAKQEERMANVRETIETESFIRGDVLRDGVVDVLDYTELMMYVLDPSKAESIAGTIKWYAADVNDDGSINVADLTKLTNKIMGYNTMEVSQVAPRVRLAEPAMTQTEESVEMNMEEVGGTKRVAILLKNVNPYVACQMDVTLPAGVTLLGESLGGSADDHLLYSNTLADGTTHRIVVSSLQNKELNANGEALVYLEVSGRAASKMTVGNVLAAAADGVLYSIGGSGEGGVTGINGVQANPSMKEKIYSVGGQIMDKFTRGINIIRNADGSVKKVLKK